MENGIKHEEVPPVKQMRLEKGKRDKRQADFMGEVLSFSRRGHQIDAQFLFQENT